MSRRVVVLSALLLIGCASLNAPPNEWQALANRATDALGVSRVWVTTQDDNRGYYHCQGSRIDLGITKGNPRWLLAHEIGHHLSGRCDESLVSEEAANAGAIRVLQTWGMSEVGAALETERHLLGLQAYRGKNPLEAHSYCEEVADVLRRFPATPDERAGSDCHP